MKSLIVGNGINIQFGGKAYTNEFIIQRVKCRVKNGDSLKLYNGIIEKSEILNILDGFVILANDIKEKKYDTLVENDKDAQGALNDFQEFHWIVENCGNLSSYKI